MPIVKNVRVYKKGELIHHAGSSTLDPVEAQKMKKRLELQYGDNDPDVEVRIEQDVLPDKRDEPEQ
jgi:hypothetical protein